MDRYSISVTVVYLLMCWGLKVGREDELAHWYDRLGRKGMKKKKKGTNDGCCSDTSVSIRREGILVLCTGKEISCCLLVVFYYFLVVDPDYKHFTFLHLLKPFSFEVAHLQIHTFSFWTRYLKIMSPFLWRMNVKVKVFWQRLKNWRMTKFHIKEGVLCFF